jgi:protein SCO1/2
MFSSRLRLVLLAAAGLIVGAVVALVVFPEARERILPTSNIRTVGHALIGGAFELTDHTGKRVTDQDFRGRYVLVFFGFTFCPDVCPSALQVMSAALDKIGSKAERITPLFVSVDPERDTPEQLATYVQSFHPRLVGLTGSADDIAKVVKAYRVYAKRVEDPKSSAGYTYDHSSIIYVMNPDGTYRTHFVHTTNVDAMADRLAKLP